MEEWQRHFINKRLEELVKATKCTPALINYLCAHHVLSDADKILLDEELETTRSRHETAKLLYSTLQKRANGYDRLFMGLLEDKQRVAAGILLIGRTEHDSAKTDYLLDTNGDDTDGTELARLLGPRLSINNSSRTNDAAAAGQAVNSSSSYKVKVSESGIHFYPTQIIDNGINSVIFKGFFQDEERKAVVKRVNSKHLDDNYTTELNTWKRLVRKSINPGTVNLVYLFDWREVVEDIESRTCYFAMEPALCNLDTRISNLNGSADEEQVQKNPLLGFLDDVANALKWLHTQEKLIHRDVKPKNILLFSTSPNSREIAKLGDFGICKFISGVSGEDCTNTMGRGTETFMAPEALVSMLSGEKFLATTALDIFSFGVTAHYALSNGQHPFNLKNDTTVTENIKSESKSPLILENREHATANHLLQWMMKKDPDHRPTISQVRAHPMFWDATECLTFLVDVAKALSVDSKTDQETKDIRAEIDANYKTWVSTNFNWRTILGDETFRLLRERRSNSKIKNYNEESLTDLLELIRDKCVHYKELKSELLLVDHFGVMTQLSQNGIFSEEKYGKYFLTRFPDLLIFMFVALTKSTMQKECLSSIKLKYYKEFDNNELFLLD